MIYNGKKWSLYGEHFVVNISQEQKKAGLTLFSSDPRKWREKPDAYPGVVEETGPYCVYVEKGDRVLVERWVYKQFDFDEERLIAKENQVLLFQKKIAINKFGPETPTNGVVVLQLAKSELKTPLIVPERVRRAQEKKRQVYMGKVLMSASKEAKVDEIIWVEKRERYQYRTPDGRLIFINCQDSWGEFPIWMKIESSTEEKVK